MRVLVTGGAGFIGSHVVDALVARGDEVVVWDNLSSGHRANLAAHMETNAIQLVERDISEATEPAAAAPFDGVVHLAAQVSVVKSVADPLYDLKTNATGLVRVLEYLKTQKNTPKVVFASSAAVYGNTVVVPTPEATACAPMSPYGIHKYAGEHWLRFYKEVHGIPSSALRFFNVYGPRQDPSSAYSGVISIFADRARKSAPITIYGDGEQSRDFIYVADVVRAIVAALDTRKSTAPINVGTGDSVTVKDLAEAIVQLSGGGSSVGFEAARLGDIRHSCARVERLESVLGVRASVAFRDGLALLLDSIKG